jgi:hypothetical protein
MTLAFFTVNLGVLRKGALDVDQQRVVGYPGMPQV